MAYDAMGNYTGADDTAMIDAATAEEELRRRREEELRKQEAARNQPVTQKITYNPDGTQKMTISGTPQALSSSQPNTPTVSGPINPNDVFKQMQQVESGNRDYTAAGAPVTSSAGAMYRNQVMPATAANPGYGIRPAANQSPEEYNRVGEEYYQAMLKQFGGDQQKAVAAYNAGPGRVQQNMQANAGQLNPQQLPKETQGYLQKVLGSALNAVIPSAQAGTVPQMNEQERLRAAQAMPGSGSSYAPSAQPAPAQPIAPGAADLTAAQGNKDQLTAIATDTTGRYPDNVKVAAQAQLAEQQRAPAPTAAVSPYALTAPTGLGLQAPGVTPTSGQMPVAEAQNKFQSAQDNLGELMKMREDPTVPAYLQQRSRERAYELMKNEQQRQQAEQKAQELIASGDGLKIANAVKGRGAPGEEGNWLKMIMLGYINPSLAGAEAVKLGLAPTKWATTTLTLPDGTETAVEIQTRSDGKIVKGTRMDGTPLTADELGAASAGVLAKGVHVTKTETYIDPATGQVVNHQTLSDGKERYLAGGKSFTGDKKILVPEKQFTAAEDRRVTTAIENLRKNIPQPTVEQTYQALVNARVPNRRIEAEMGLQPGTLGAGNGRTTLAPATSAPATSAPITASTTAATATPAQQRTALTTADQPPAEPVIRDIRPGERKDQYDAYVKQQNEAYKKQLDEHQNAIKLKQKDADEFSKKRFEVKSTLDKFRDGIDIIKSGNHNLGPNFSVSGAGPLPRVQQFFGEQFGTDDSANTAILRGLITRGGLEGIKNYMGPAISNFDVQTWMKNNPISENSPPAAIEAWLTKTHNAMLDAAEAQRVSAVKQGFVEPSFSLGNRIEAAQPQGAGTTSSGNKFKRVQ